MPLISPVVDAFWGSRAEIWLAKILMTFSVAKPKTDYIILPPKLNQPRACRRLSTEAIGGA